MDCVVVAGGRPTVDDPLYPFTQGKPKALLEIAGRPLIDYVLAALLDAHAIDHIVVVGLDEDLTLTYGPSVQAMTDRGGMVANGLAGLAQIQARQPATRHVLFTSADIPAVTGPTVDALVADCQPFDHCAYYFMVERQLMESHYPGSNRTYVPLKDLQIAGADMFVADAALADGNSQLLMDLTAGRKHAWKLARLVGPATLLRLWLRRLTLSGIEHRAEAVLGSPVSIRLTGFPQLAMDVDKPEQLFLMRNLLSGMAA